jgi:uncharacterized protein
VSRTRYVACPRCGAQVAWLPENAYRPFCSERCKMIDLGAWATEEYRVPANEPDGPESEPDDNPPQ